jgi:hypothetical protein
MVFPQSRPRFFWREYEFSADEEKAMRQTRRAQTTGCITDAECESRPKPTPKPSWNPLTLVTDALNTTPASLLSGASEAMFGDALNPMARLQTYRDQKAKMQFDQAEAQYTSDVVPRGDWAAPRIIR